MYERISTHDGTMLQGKRAALAFMIKMNYTNEDQEKLYLSLKKMAGLFINLFLSIGCPRELKRD